MTLEKKYDRDTIPPHQQVLCTERLRFTPAKEHHEEGFWEMLGNAEVIKYIPCELQTDRAEHKRNFLKDLNEGKRFKFGFVIEWLNNPCKAIGWSIARPTEDGQLIEVGYFLHRDVWGQGLATEIANQLVDFCENTMKWPKEDLTAIVAIGNTASRRVLEKAGFFVAKEDDFEGKPIWRFKRI